MVPYNNAKIKNVNNLRMWYLGEFSKYQLNSVNVG